MAFVEFKNVVKQYQMGEVTIKASDGVDFEIEKGEFVVIVGRKRSRKNHNSEYVRRNGYL